MPRQLLITLALLVASAAPAAAEETVDQLLVRLRQFGLAARLEAAAALLDRGEAARPGLERLMSPANAPERTYDDDGEAEVAKLIVKLGHAQFNIREKATRTLTRLGKAAVLQLEETVATGKNLEVVTQAKTILNTIDKDHAIRREIARTEAGYLLAHIGNRKSIPALRAALKKRDVHVAAAAMFALRAILRRGPEADVRVLHRAFGKTRQAWYDILDGKPSAPAGKAVTLVVGYDKDSRLAVESEVSYISHGHGGRVAEAPPRRWTSEVRQKEQAFVTVQATSPPILLRRLREHVQEQVDTDVDYPGRVPAPKRSWKGKPLQVKFDAKGALTLTLSGKRLDPAAFVMTIPPGAIIPLGLPGGEYAPGRSREVGKPLAHRMLALIYSGQKVSLLRHAGALTYTGGDDTHHRYFLTLTLHGRGASGPMRYHLQGTVTADARSRRINSYRLCGPSILYAHRMFSVPLSRRKVGRVVISEHQLRIAVRISPAKEDE